MGHCNAPKAEGRLGPPPVRAAEEKPAQVSSVGSPGSALPGLLRRALHPGKISSRKLTSGIHLWDKKKKKRKMGQQGGNGLADRRP